jgi:transcriptional regulator with XRE-family HTH domain
MEPHIRLKSWLEAANVTQADFARRLGYDPSNMAKLLKKSIRPTLDMAFRIEAQTGGVIPASAWVQDAATQGEAA